VLKTSATKGKSRLQQLEAEKLGIHYEPIALEKKESAMVRNPTRLPPKQAATSFLPDLNSLI
jgi:hypothetical protein